MVHDVDRAGRLAREATEFVQDVSTQLLFDHSRRVFLWASLQGEKLGLDYDPELLYVGAMFHDIGLVEGHRSEHERFEIDAPTPRVASSSATGCPRSMSRRCGTRSRCTRRRRFRTTSGRRSGW